MPEGISQGPIHFGKAEYHTPSSVHIESEGFHRNDKIHIKGYSVSEVAYKYGQEMKSVTQKTLEEAKTLVEKDGEKTMQEVQEITQQALDHFEKLTKSHAFTINGINYGERYLDQIDGFAKGSDIKPWESVFLQMEGDTGCQTLFVQDKASGRINIIHTEENTEDAWLMNYNRRQDEKAYKQTQSEDQPEHKKTKRGPRKPEAIQQKNYGYRLVDMFDGDKRISFFGYPGISGGGPAMGINHETNTFTAVDTLLTKTDTDPKTSVWVNAIASMMLDIGDIDLAQTFVKNLNDHHVTFSGGYAIHMAQGGKTPRMTSFEFGSTNAVEQLPEERSDRRIIAQPNLSRSPELQAKDELHHPEEPDENDKQWIIGVPRQMRRLRHLGGLLEIPKGSIREILSRLKKIAGNPFGDIDTTDTLRNDHPRDSMTSLPSVWQAGYTVVTIGENIDAIFGKRHPPKIQKKEFGLQGHTNPHKGARKNLLEMAQQWKG